MFLKNLNIHGGFTPTALAPPNAIILIRYYVSIALSAGAEGGEGTVSASSNLIFLFHLMIKEVLEPENERKEMRLYPEQGLKLSKKNSEEKTADDNHSCFESEGMCSYYRLKGIILWIGHIFSRPVHDRPVRCCRCRKE